MLLPRAILDPVKCYQWLSVNCSLIKGYMLVTQQVVANQSAGSQMSQIFMKRNSKYLVCK